MSVYVSLYLLCLYESEDIFMHVGHKIMGQNKKSLDFCASAGTFK